MAPGLLRKTIQAIQLIAVCSPGVWGCASISCREHCHRPSTGTFVTMRHESCRQNFRLDNRLGTRMRRSAWRTSFLQCDRDQPCTNRSDGWEETSDALAQHIAFGSGVRTNCGCSAEPRPGDWGYNLFPTQEAPNVPCSFFL